MKAFTLQSYEYQSVEEEELPNDQQTTGQRLIGAKKASTTDYPYAVAWRPHTNEGTGAKGLCSGSLINSKWFLTAAHCLAFRRKKPHINGEVLCTSTTEDEGHFEMNLNKGGVKQVISFKCRLVKEAKMYEVIPLTYFPEVWLGMADIHTQLINEGEKRKVIRLIKHEFSYQSERSHKISKKERAFAILIFF